jgi:hypothetical protein
MNDGTGVSDQADCHQPPTSIQGVLYSLDSDQEL